jgi:biotin transport system substrate-specific component
VSNSSPIHPLLFPAKAVAAYHASTYTETGLAIQTLEGFMATASTVQPLINGILPQNKATRLAIQVGLAVAGTLFLTLTAKTKVVLGPVDMNLGTLGIFLIASAFGLRLGLATVMLYMAQGAAGLPVFQSSPEKGVGLLYMMGTTGGYLAGYVLMTAIVGWASDRGWGRSIVKFGAALLLAELVLMALGFSWLAMLIGVEGAWTFGVVPFVAADLIKLAIVALGVPALLRLRS